MSGKNYELSLVMRLRDMASRGFNLATRDMQAGIARTEKATSNLTRAVTEYSKKREAAAALGIRSEHDIQREIQRTEAAYNRLARSGTLSMQEQARAAQQLRTRLRELNNEAGRFSLGQRASGMMKGVRNFGAGALAGGYVLAKPVEQTMDYGMRLAQMANTAYTDRNTAGRIAGKRELNAAIVNAVRQGGGTRDSAAEALDAIIASGTMSAKDATSILPSITKAASASGANTTELAQIAIRAMQTFKLKASDMPGILDMGIAAGQAGGFELKDMAKWLPQQMAMATNLGMKGKADFARLAAWNQASVITAGTKDEAGNNLRDLLMEVNTPHFAQHLQKVGVQNADKIFLKAQANGVNKVDATIDVVRQIVEHDKTYKSLQAKLKSAKGNDEKQSIIEAMTAQVQGTNVGKIFHNQQSLMALVGLMNNQEYVKETLGKTHAGEGNATDKNFAVISDEAGFKVQQAANEKEFATTTAFEKLTPLVGSVADGFSAIAKEYPTLTAATIAAATALTALAAAAGAAALSNAVGKGGAAGLLGGRLGSLASGAGRLAAGAGRAAFTGLRALSLPGLAAFGAVEGGGAVINGLRGEDASNMASRAMQGTGAYDALGSIIAATLAALGNDKAQEAINVTLHVDGEQLTTVVNRRNERGATRH